MPSPIPVTAVFDIGKTNKKFFLFDENYAVVERHQAELHETTDEDGFPCEDLNALEIWIKEQINKAIENESVRIQALNFSAYGASLVHLDQDGKKIASLYNYLKSYPEDLLARFYKSVGGRKKFSLQTASPQMGMLNSGLQLYWLKYKKPEIFKKIECSLHFPNYLSTLFTGRRFSELTSIGCHTGLWDFTNNKYHDWLTEEELRGLLPITHPVKETFTIENDIRVGLGIHDSSAALAPYLLTINEPFILISTGTWSIAFNPFNNEPLTYQELEKDCLCYLNIFEKQVKSSRFFLGKEYAHQKKKIEKHFGVLIHENEIKLDAQLLNKLIQRENSEYRLQLEKAYHSGPFPQTEAGSWQVHLHASPEEAYHQLMLDLAAIQAESLKLVQGSEKVDRLIFTGGFSRNKFFLSLLASFFPDKSIYTSLLPDASALGAALVVNGVVGKGVHKHLLKNLLTLKRHQYVKELNLSGYVWNNPIHRDR